MAVLCGHLDAFAGLASRNNPATQYQDNRNFNEYLKSGAWTNIQEKSVMSDAIKIRLKGRMRGEVRKETPKKR